MKIKIYSGMSLSKADVKLHLSQAHFSGPISRGDLAKDIDSGFHVIGIIDGHFYDRPAVTPSEILDAIRHGVVVFGSSSMGALRAAELAPFGMRGVGQIFDWLNSTNCAEDDFWGQVVFDHFRPAPSLIEIKLVLDRLYRIGKISIGQSNSALRAIGQIHFSERSTSAIKKALNHALGSGAQISPVQILKRCVIKRQDGLLLLRAISRHKTIIAKFGSYA